jgi:MFS family permease
VADLVSPSTPSSATLSLAAQSPLRAAGVVVGSTIGNGMGVTPTITAAFGVFLVPIAAEFHWLRAGVSGAAAILSLATALASPLAGRLGDLWGARRSVLVGSLALGLAILSLGLAIANPIVFYLQFALIGAAGALPSSMLYAKLLAEWFETRRGLWMGIAGGVGNGLGATFIPVLAGVMLAATNWRGAFVGIALIVLLIGLPLQIVLLRKSATPQTGGADVVVDDVVYEGVSTSQALKSAKFWVLATALPIGGGCLTAMFATIVPLITDRGFSLAVATTAVAICGLTSTVWEPTVGYILDRSRQPRVLAPFYLIAAVGLYCLLHAPTPAVLFAGAVMVGIGLGSEFSALSFLLSRYFGRRELGAISGVAFAVLLGAGALALVLLNLTYDLSKSYAPAVLAITPFLVWNSLATVLLGRYRFGAGSDAS